MSDHFRDSLRHYIDRRSRTMEGAHPHNGQMTGTPPSGHVRKLQSTTPDSRVLGKQLLQKPTDLHYWNELDGRIEGPTGRPVPKFTTKIPPQIACSSMATTTTTTANVIIRRPVLNRIEFDEFCQKFPQEESSICDILTKEFHKMCQCSGTCLKGKLLDCFPFINTLRTYKLREYLIKDIFAGISVGIIHIPQGMGFALLTAVAPVYGLYSSFFPVLVYFFLGTSRHASVGTMAVISILLGTVVEREAEWFLSNRLSELNATEASPLRLNSFDNIGISGNTSDLESELSLYKASVAAGVSLVSSCIMLLMGILRMGVITTFMPTSFLGGFTTGAAFHITTSQIKSMLGIQVTKHEGIMKIPYTWVDIGSKLPTVSIPTLIVSLVTLVLLIFFKEFINEKFKKKLPLPIPIEMLVLIIGTVLSHFLFFNNTWDIKIVGPIPRGIPAPFVPPLERTTYFLGDAFIIAILSFAISISMADLFARKHKYPIDANQELIANGLSYGLSSFFYCFIGASAPPRCIVQDTTGGKTQVASIFAALLLLLVLLAIGPLFQSLPNSVLSCIIVVALFPLFKQFKILPTLWRISKADFSIWVVTLMTAIFLDLTYSLAIGIGWGIVTIAITAMTASGHNLGIAHHQDLYAPVKMYKNVRIHSGVAIFRYESGLFFASIKNFKEQLFKATVDPQTLHKTLPNKIEARKENGVTNEAMEEIHVVKETEATTEKDSEIDTQANGIETSHDLTGCDSQTGGEPLEAIILDCSSFGHVDFMGLGVLKQLQADYGTVGVQFLLAGCTSTLMDKLWADRQLGGENGDSIQIYPTIADALLAISQTRHAEDMMTAL